MIDRLIELIELILLYLLELRSHLRVQRCQQLPKPTANDEAIIVFFHNIYILLRMFVS